MIVTLSAHEPSFDDDGEQHRFHFVVDDGEHEPRSDSVTLRTARVLVRELGNYTALDAMLRVIVSTKPDDYDSLTSRSFEGK